ncbi:MAG TPA: mannose-1-phosphate guanylyltransferase [Terriglobales bacterium]|nr:mannose-1-phosphate guanylyltransferase [Terriglobales bacterium]
MKNFYPVILAGGRGTRFWPLSRKKHAKQLLPLDGKQTMIQQTVARLLRVAPVKQFWVITNGDLRDGIVKQLPKVDKKRIIAEPVGRNTAPAIGLAAFILLRQDRDAVLGLFPSDQVIADEKAFQKNIERGVEIAANGENIVVMGIQPTRPETGYGYIESGVESEKGVLRVRRFREKPDLATAERFLEAGNYFWNSGMFLWRARTLVDALGEYLPKMVGYLEEIADAYGTRKFESVFSKLYPKCDNISVDYAVLEPRSARGEQEGHIYCIPSDFGWNDLGSWAALYEHRLSREKKPDPTANVIAGDKSFLLNAEGNYIHAPGKFVAAVGVKDLVVVETADALLITTRDKAQDVGKVVKYLDEKKMEKLV